MNRRRRTVTLAATALLSAAVLVAGTRPRVPAAFRLVPDWVQHGSTYAVLGYLASASATALSVGAAGPLAFAYAVAHGCLLELLQTLVPTRSAEAGDVAADAVGAALGVVVAARAVRR